MVEIDEKGIKKNSATTAKKSSKGDLQFHVN
jgi:hypothetical protein